MEDSHNRTDDQAPRIMHLDEAEIRIVTYIAVARPPKQATVAHIAHILGASTKRTEGLLRRMEEKKIVNHLEYPDGRTRTYGLDQVGEDYAVSTGIVK